MSFDRRQKNFASGRASAYRSGWSRADCFAAMRDGREERDVSLSPHERHSCPVPDD